MQDLKCNRVMMQVASGTTESRQLDSYFKPFHSGSEAHSDNRSYVQPPESTDLLLAKLSTPLSLPDGDRLTRSERLFSIATHTDVRSMALKGDDEFFLFMDMRAEKQWASFNMTSRKWVAATQEFNARLEALNIKKNNPTVRKNPRALMDLLGQIEPKISERIIRNDFICKSWDMSDRTSSLTLFCPATHSNTDTFWKKHCGAVTLIKSEHPSTSNPGKMVRAML